MHFFPMTEMPGENPLSSRSADNFPRVICLAWLSDSLIRGRRLGPNHFKFPFKIILINLLPCHHLVLLLGALTQRRGAKFNLKLI